MAVFPFLYSGMAVFLSLMIIATAHGGYGQIDKPNPEKEKLLSTIIGIQGIVYCTLGHRTILLEGAVTRITCLAVDEYGYETTPISILSSATDAKGYFFATLSPFEVQENQRIRECKAFLELSPLETCQVPTDRNRGLSGAPLQAFQFLQRKNMKLFTVGPFFFSSEPNSLAPTDDGY